MAPPGEGEARMSWSVERKVAWGFGLARAVLLVIGVASYRCTIGLVGALGSVSHTHAVIETIEGVSARVKTVESASRGFVLTGNTQFLSEQRKAAAEIPAYLVRLGDLCHGVPSQEMRLGD